MTPCFLLGVSRAYLVGGGLHLYPTWGDDPNIPSNSSRDLYIFVSFAWRSPTTLEIGVVEFVVGTNNGKRLHPYLARDLDSEPSLSSVAVGRTGPRDPTYSL